MKIDIYQSTKDSSKYLSVPEGTALESLQLPDEVNPEDLKLSLFKAGIEIDPNKPRIALDENDVKKQIEEKGYAIHGAKAEFRIKGN